MPDLPSSSINDRAAVLRRELERHNRLYYINAQPEISDFAYDALYEELAAIERNHPELATADSPTRRVGGDPVAVFGPVLHDPPMLSLDNTYERGEIDEFDAMLRRLLGTDGSASPAYVVEPKIDGLAFSLRYEQGLLVSAATRGDGTRGDNVTANVLTIRSIPLHILSKADVLEVRGEIFMPKERFQSLSQAQQDADAEQFMNPRNAAVGSLKLLDARLVAARGLDAILYSADRIEGSETPATHAALLDWLGKLGLPTPPRVWKCPDLPAVHAAISELDTLRHGFAFETDGAVIKLDDRSLYARLGTTAKAPRWARAFKYPPDQAETVVEAISVQVGRTGVLTPVAELRTVRLAGSDISRATLHNEDEIRRKDVRIGDHVLVEKAGEVIPAVVRVLAEKRFGSEIEFHMPDRCPACGADVKRREGEVALRCTNFLCPAQLIARLTHFASREALDLEGLGGRVAKALVDQGLIRDPLDLFDDHTARLCALTLPEQDDDIRSGPAEAELLPPEPATQDSVKPRKQPRLGAKRTGSLVEALEQSRSLPLARWLYAIGIPSVGAASAREISACHRDFHDLANSVVLREIAHLYDLQDEAARLNPNSKAVKSLGTDQRVAAAERYSILLDRIEIVGRSLAARRLAKRDKTANARYSSPITPEICRAVNRFFLSDAGRAFVARMDALGINPQSECRTHRDEPLAGRTYVLTGTLFGCSRQEAARLLRLRGAGVAESLSKGTTALIAGENPGESKVTNARKLGVPVISEADYLKILKTSVTAAFDNTRQTGAVQEEHGRPSQSELFRDPPWAPDMNRTQATS